MFYLSICLFFVWVHPITGGQNNLRKWMSANYGCNDDESMVRLLVYLDKGMRNLEPRTRKTLLSMIDAGFDDNFNETMNDDDVLEKKNVCDAGSNDNVEPTGIFRKSSLDNARFPSDSPQPDCTSNIENMDNDRVNNDDKRGNNYNDVPPAKMRVMSTTRTTLRPKFKGSNDDVIEMNNWDSPENNRNEMRNFAPRQTIRKSSLPTDNKGIHDNNIEKQGDDGDGGNKGVADIEKNGDGGDGGNMGVTDIEKKGDEGHGGVANSDVVRVLNSLLQRLCGNAEDVKTVTT